MKVNKDGTKNQHSDQIQTQKGICMWDSGNCAISAEWRTHKL